MVSRRHLLAAFVSTFALVSSPVSAFADPAAGEFITKLADTAMTTVAAKGLSDDERAKRFRTLFVDNFDLPGIGKLVLARYWSIPSTTDAQRAEFVKLFEDIQVLTWARRFKDYSGEKVEILALDTGPTGDIQIESRINRDKLDPINIGWSVRKAGAAYRVLDIKVEGASMTQTHRAEYSSVIQSNGGTVDGLLAAMRKKIVQLQAEAKTN
jgi:phospholipid transport system substrate-binding protein